MALSGTLADIGIVELVQFPSNGRKTGELIIAGPDDEARLYYLDGSLVHTNVGELSGMEGLVEVVSWSTGEFEFRMGVECEPRTIELDLHRVLMLALKTRDERAEAARKRTGTGNSETGGSNVVEKVQNLLEKLVGSTDALNGAYLLSSDGSIIAKAQTDVSSEEKDLKTVMNQITLFYENYAREKLGRIFLEDDEGILHASRIGSSHIAVIGAGREVSLGVVSMMMNKLVTGMVGMA
jgi:predicted regulator of Ras-like GTPase activity (Roadblock/LC7/MglB family)